MPLNVANVVSVDCICTVTIPYDRTVITQDMLYTCQAIKIIHNNDGCLPANCWKSHCSVQISLVFLLSSLPSATRTGAIVVRICPEGTAAPRWPPPPFSFLPSLSSYLLPSLPSLNAICGSTSVHESGSMLTQWIVVVNWLIRFHSPRENKRWFCTTQWLRVTLLWQDVFTSPQHTLQHAVFPSEGLASGGLIRKWHKRVESSCTILIGVFRKLYLVYVCNQTIGLAFCFLFKSALHLFEAMSTDSTIV